MVPMEHVIKEGKIGNTTYFICEDAYKTRTQEEIVQTMYNLQKIGEKILLNKGKQEEYKNLTE